MTSFYKYLLSVFCFTCVSAFATPATVVPTTQLNNYIVKPAYIIKPDFKIGSFGFPACDCDKQGKPLSSCEEQTAKASVRTIIDKNGIPTSVVIAKSSGSAQADRYLVQRFRSARFSPALKNNQPIISIAEQSFSFSYIPQLNPLTCPIEKPKIEELVK